MGLADRTRSLRRILSELGGAVHDGASLDDGGRREGGSRGLGGEERGREGVNDWDGGGGGRRGRGHGDVREVERNGARDGVGERRAIVLYCEGVVHGGGVGGTNEKLEHRARESERERERERGRETERGKVGMGRPGEERSGNFWCTREGGGVGCVMWGLGENFGIASGNGAQRREEGKKNQGK